jgi:hydroxymethylbilane synthase
MAIRLIKIGTRNSELALWQANYLAQQLESKGFKTELVVTEDTITTSENSFTKAVESLLFNNLADIAIHSLKDLGTIPNNGLVLAGLSLRANPSDCLLLHNDAYDVNQLFKMKSGITIGTSSERRREQLLNYRPDVNVISLKGNIIDRINEVRQNNIEGIIIAKAGIDRLQLDVTDLQIIPLHPKEFIPAPGQGVLAYQVKEENIELRKIVMQLHQYDIALCTNVERSIFRELGAVCKSSLGVYCEKDVRGMYHCHLFSKKNDRIIKIKYSQSTTFGLADEMVKLYHQQLSI